MKKAKQEKGITLIALIITIIVLLILAVVTIGAVQDSKIIEHAENAGKNYNQAKINETVAVEGYESFIERYVSQAAKIEYYGIWEDGIAQMIQKIDRIHGIAIVYLFEDGKFVEYAENNFIEGNPTTEIIKINLGNGEVDLPAGAIPIISNGVIGAYFSNNKLYGNNGEKYSIFELVTDKNEIDRIEEGIAKINQ